MVNDAVNFRHVRRALVIKLRHHGDVLLSSPVFTVLKKHAPEVEIDALVYRDTVEMLSGHPAISQIHSIDRAWKDLGPFARLAQEWRLLARLRSRRYDLLVHLTEHPRGAWLKRFLGARYGVAPADDAKGRFWEKSFSHLYRYPKVSRHRVETNLDALRRIGIYPPPEERALTLVPGAQAEAAADALLAHHGLRAKEFIHLHPASRWRFKCWPADKTAEMINALAPHKFVVTAAPDEQELGLVQDILGGVRQPVVNLAGKLTLKQLAALTAKARCFIGVDSAPMHIASAMQTPVVALFGPSGELEWGPWKVAHRVVTSGHPCRPCGLDGCGGGKVSDCLVTLPVARVVDAVNDLLRSAC